jgi:DNA-directed RNA polymerase specialized sigma24 family protein
MPPAPATLQTLPHAPPPRTADARLDGACRRFRQLARKLLGRYPGARPADRVDAALNDAEQALRAALADAGTLDLAAFATSAGRYARDLLVALAGGASAVRGEAGAETADAIDPWATRGDSSPSAAAAPDARAAWAALHAKVATLPEAGRQTFDLLWYLGLPPGEAAGALGVGEPALRRRWQAARLRLWDELGGVLPPEE